MGGLRRAGEGSAFPCTPSAKGTEPLWNSMFRAALRLGLYSINAKDVNH